MEYVSYFEKMKFCRERGPNAFISLCGRFGESIFANFEMWQSRDQPQKCVPAYLRRFLAIFRPQFEIFICIPSSDAHLHSTANRFLQLLLTKTKFRYEQQHQEMQIFRSIFRKQLKFCCSSHCQNLMSSIKLK